MKLAKTKTAVMSRSISDCRDNFAIGIRVSLLHRSALEHAAAARGLSTAAFVEWCVSRALADAGLIERPNPEGP